MSSRLLHVSAMRVCSGAWGGRWMAWAVVLCFRARAAAADGSRGVRLCVSVRQQRCLAVCY